MVYAYNPYGVFLLGEDGTVYDVESFDGNQNSLLGVLVKNENSSFVIHYLKTIEKIYDLDPTDTKVTQIDRYCTRYAYESDALAEYNNGPSLLQDINEFRNFCYNDPIQLTYSDTYIATIGQLRIIGDNYSKINEACAKIGLFQGLGNLSYTSLQWCEVISNVYDGVREYDATFWSFNPRNGNAVKTYGLNGYIDVIEVSDYK